MDCGLSMPYESIICPTGFRGGVFQHASLRRVVLCLDSDGDSRMPLKERCAGAKRTAYVIVCLIARVVRLFA